MAATENNWVYEKDFVSEISKRMLEKARRMESQRIQEGWRWVKVSKNTRVLVPFDKKGRITVHGKRILDEAKKNCI